MKYSSVGLIDDENHPTPLLKRKIRLSGSVCLLLFVIFFSSTVVATLISHCWFDEIRCPEKIVESDLIQRSKRDASTEKRSLLCTNMVCCETSLDPSNPWNKPRLPNTVKPIDYQLKLSLYQLNGTNDEFDGDIVIVSEVQQSTRDIILHGSSFRYANIKVTPHGIDNPVEIPIDCAFPFPATETLVIHMKDELNSGTIYDIRIEFSRTLSKRGTGVFELQFNADRYGLQQSQMILTHFEAVHAREAYPCFDEPGFKAKFQLSVQHQFETKILSNWDERETFQNDVAFSTEFETTPEIPTSLTAFAIFYTKDFSSRNIALTYPWGTRQIQISLWARTVYFENDGGVYIDATLEMIGNIFAAYLRMFQEITHPIVPNNMKFLAVPDYPSDAISHWGLMIFTERMLLHNPGTTSQLEQQRIALLIAKEIAEQWFGNLISFRWWNELWLQEGIANYLKYEAVNQAYPQWNIRDQYIAEELLPIMMDDSLSTSHPIVKSVNSPAEINELFDRVESSKASSILRMADYFATLTTSVQDFTKKALVSYIRDHLYGFLIPDELIRRYTIGPWNGFDFFDRWLLQSNYPSVSAKISWDTSTSRYMFQLQQNRFLNGKQIEFDLYPTETTPFGHVWYIPVRCSFGNDSTRLLLNKTFHLSQKSMNFDLGDSSYNYFYCNNDFNGYYIMDYTDTNWGELSELILNDNIPLSSIDYANLLNTAFLDAQSSDESYSVIVGIVQRFSRQNFHELVPWQTLAYHANWMLDILEFEPLYRVVQKYFEFISRKTYQEFSDQLWNNSGSAPEKVLKQIIAEFSCRVGTRDCINRITDLWYTAYNSLVVGSANHSVPNHVRRLVYRTHFQNSYNDTEWLNTENQFHVMVDVQEREHLLEAMTQSHQTWHLYQLLYDDGEANRDRDVDILELLTLLAKNPIGRELSWFYYRHNWEKLQKEYGRSNPRLGQLLIDISKTFEDEFHENELLEFIASKPGVEDNASARFWALEQANKNYWWVIDNVNDITTAFVLQD